MSRCPLPGVAVRQPIRSPGLGGSKFLHPRPVVCAQYLNASKNDVLDDLLVIGQEEKVVCKRLQSCILMCYVDFDDGQILHAVTRFCKVQQEGPVEFLFDRPPEGDLGGGGMWLVRLRRLKGVKYLQF